MKQAIKSYLLALTMLSFGSVSFASDTSGGLQKCTDSPQLHSLSDIAEYRRGCDQVAERARRATDKARDDARLAMLSLDTASSKTKQAESELSQGQDDGTKAAANSSLAGNLGDFFGSKFGLAVGAAHALGKQRVDSATVVNGLIRVEQARTDRPIVAFEAHHFIFGLSGLPTKGDRIFAHGPFASVQSSSSSSSIASFGLGWMFAWSDPIEDHLTDTKSWNLGVGILLEGESKYLGDGLRANQPLPVGESQVRYKTSSGRSLFLIVSRSLF